MAKKVKYNRLGINIKDNNELEIIIYANDINQEVPCHLNSSNYTEYFKGQYKKILKYAEIHI